MGVFLRACALALLGGAWSIASAAGAGIEAQDPWVPAAPPSAKVLALYAVLNNPTDQPRVLVAASSPVFEQVEIHRTVIRDNIARMERVKELSIPARKSVALKPGGLHLMLITPKQPVAAGSRVALTLSFKDGSTLPIEAPVRAAARDDHHGHDHKGHGH